MLLNPNYKKAITLILIIVFSFVVSLLINSPQLEIANRQEKEITIENLDSIKLNDNDIVKIQGTINPLEVLKNENGNTYYSGLEEFGNKIIVRADLSKLNSSVQTFSGTVKKLDNSFGDNLIEAMNKEINLTGTNSFDPKLADQIKESSKNDFKNTAILVVDSERLDSGKVITQIVVLSVLLIFLFLLILRDKVLIID